MNKYISAIFIGASLTVLTGCDDYLTKEPESSIIPERFFSSESELAAYAIGLYGNFPSHSSTNNWGFGTFSLDNGTDNQAAMDYSSMWTPGNWLVPATSSTWDFTFIRNCNYFFDNVLPKYEAGEIQGSETNIRQYIGEMYLLRAYAYWQKYTLYGDFPIVLTALPDDKEVLMEATVRQPRNKVARQILDDLANAINFLPESAVGGKNRLNKACAQLLRSRVALYEGTWLKYHKGTALVPGGPGWPGDASLLGSFDIDSEIQYFLQEAMTSAKPVGDAIVNNLVANTDTPEGMTPALAVANPYFAMFGEADIESYNEVLFYRAYSHDQSIYNNIQEQLMRNGGNTGWTRGMVNSFVMRNGLPIYAAGSGYDPDWENQGITATLQNRDSRIQIFTKGDECVNYWDTEGNPVYFIEGYLIVGSTQERIPTGFALKKGKAYDYQLTFTGWGNTSSIVFRATEAMLNYMEACVELKGTPDQTADSYWRALRRRAYVNDDYNVTIAATNMAEEAKGDWGAYSAGTLINPTLYNVRRERRNELCAEGHRLNDLCRWCALDQLIATPYQIEGMKFWGTVYDVTAGANPLNLKNQNGEVITIVPDINKGDNVLNGPEQSLYVRPYQRTTVNNLCFDGYKFTRAHYLYPLPVSAFNRTSPDETVANSVLYQNPGWGTEAGLPATSF